MMMIMKLHSLISSKQLVLMLTWVKNRLRSCVFKLRDIMGLIIDQSGYIA